MYKEFETLTRSKVCGEIRTMLLSFSTRGASVVVVASEVTPRRQKAIGASQKLQSTSLRKRIYVMDE